MPGLIVPVAFAGLSSLAVKGGAARTAAAVANAIAPVTVTTTANVMRNVTGSVAVKRVLRSKAIGRAAAALGLGSLVHEVAKVVSRAEQVDDVDLTGLLIDSMTSGMVARRYPT
jgi:hypothetical protein